MLITNCSNYSNKNLHIITKRNQLFRFIFSDSFSVNSINLFTRSFPNNRDLNEEVKAIVHDSNGLSAVDRNDRLNLQNDLFSFESFFQLNREN